MLSVKILSPQRPYFEGSASSMTLPGLLGEMQVLPDYAVFVGELVTGIILVDGEDQKRAFFIKAGFVDVCDNSICVLADNVESSEDIDLKRAEEAENRANKLLENITSENLDIARALSALERARARLRLKKMQVKR